MKLFKMVLPHTGSLSEDDIFLDIETNGLFPNRHKIIVCGLIKKEQKETVLLQYCIDNDNERELIENISDELSTKKNIYTFHGNIFEFPFLKYKQKKLLLPNQIPYDKAHDLSPAISSFRHILNLPDYRRSTIENHFQIRRVEQIDVHEWTSKNEISEEFQWTEDAPVLRHNRSELLSLLELKSAFKNWKKSMAFYFPAFGCNMYLSNYNFSKNTASIMFLIEKTENKIPLISFCDGLDISFKDNTLILKFDTISGTTNKNNTVISPVISPSRYFKKNHMVNIDNLLSVSKEILLYLFCN